MEISGLGHSLERDQLETSLSQSHDNLEGSHTYLQQFQLQQKDEKRDRARLITDKAANMLSDGIPLDRESLVKQLDLLRYINMRLQNQKNVAETIDARLRNTRETNHRNTKPVQEKGFVSKIQYYPTTFPRGDDC